MEVGDFNHINEEIVEKDYYNCEIGQFDIEISETLITIYYVRHKFRKHYVEVSSTDEAYLAARLMDLEYIISDRSE